MHPHLRTPDNHKLHWTDNHNHLPYLRQNKIYSNNYCESQEKQNIYVHRLSCMKNTLHQIHRMRWICISDHYTNRIPFLHTYAPFPQVFVFVLFYNFFFAIIQYILVVFTKLFKYLQPLSRLQDSTPHAEHYISQVHYEVISCDIQKLPPGLFQSAVIFIFCYSDFMISRLSLP